jgi:hypothetical protein
VGSIGTALSTLRRRSATPQIIIQIGKETQMDRLHRYEKEANFTADAKAVSLMFIVGMVALLAAHTTEMPGVGIMASAPTVLIEPTREVPLVGVDIPDGPKLPAQESARAAARVRDEPPIAPF